MCVFFLERLLLLFEFQYLYMRVIKKIKSFRTYLVVRFLLLLFFSKRYENKFFFFFKNSIYCYYYYSITQNSNFILAVIIEYAKVLRNGGVCGS